MDINKFKIENRELLRQFYELYTKFSGNVPLNKMIDFINDIDLNDDDKNEFIDVLINDNMISLEKSDILNHEEIEEVEEDSFEDVIIDEIDVTNHLKAKTEQSIFWKRKLTVEDEAKLFEFYATKIRENEYEYFSIPELINVMLDSQAYAKTYEVKRFIKMFVDVLEDNF